MKKYIYYLTIFSAIITTVLIARSFRVNEIPNGSVSSCANCHVNPAGGGARNSFGAAIQNGHLDGGGHVIWNAEIAALDSDGDGFTNGEELQDPNGTWTSGTIGNPDLVTNPGDPNSHPEPNSVEVEITPTEYSLSQNYPNPFNPSTVIKYNLPEKGFTTLTVYNSLGEKVSQLVNGFQYQGSYSVKFSAENLSSGIYIYKLQSGNFSMTRKMILMK